MKKGVLKAKTNLKAKTPLKASPKKRKAPVPLLKKTAAALIEPTDKLYSKYIRLRDSDFVDGQFVGTCITCPREMVVYSGGKWIKGPQNGHMIGRGCFSLRYDEMNCNLQCAHCNAWLDKDEMITRYRKAVDEKYGEGTYKDLKARSKLEDAYKRPSKPELLQIIEECKTLIEYYLKQETS